MAKKWYVREKNSSRYINSEWIYYYNTNVWGELDKAKQWKTKKEATAYCNDILKRGEVYGK